MIDNTFILYKSLDGIMIVLQVFCHPQSSIVFRKISHAKMFIVLFWGKNLLSSEIP